MHWRALLLGFGLAAPIFARDRIAYIEFFGYRGIDAEAVRKALPFREGDAVPDDFIKQAHAIVKGVTGGEATAVTAVCCTGDGDSVIFIGLPGTSSQAFTYNPVPPGDVVPPSELTATYRKMKQAEEVAFNSGIFEEDGSPGYRLSKEPGARAAQLALREYALQHEGQIVHLLESSGNAGRRAMAADALGYAARSARQMAALVRAARDRDSGVRNDSTRALSEILRGDPSAAAQIPPDNFIDMIRSGTWSDRNKSSMVLWPLTQTRDPRLLERLKSEASDALLEMARWRSNGWAYAPRVILARIAGIPEERIDELAEGPLDKFLAAIGR